MQLLLFALHQLNEAPHVDQDTFTPQTMHA